MDLISKGDLSKLPLSQMYLTLWLLINYGARQTVIEGGLHLLDIFEIMIKEYFVCIADGEPLSMERVNKV